MYKWVTLDDRKLMQKLLNDGKSMREISRILQKNYTTIHREVSFGGGRKNYSWQKSQQIREEIRLKSHANKGKAFQALSNRIEILQEEIEKLKQIIGNK